MNKKKAKAVVLMSGGLDSTLAAKMLIEQGVEVKGIFFNTGFCVLAQKKRVGEDVEPDIFRASKMLDVDLKIEDISNEFISLISNPKFGWGKNINPCIDCRIFMLQKAKQYAEEIDADFIATGEVVGQRPKSQKKRTQFLIEKEAGLQGKLVRPLSAKFFPATQAEKDGLVDRLALGDINGRSRKKQIALAKNWNLTDTAAVGGGCCFLTDKTFANRFKDLISDRLQFLHIDQKQAIDQEQVVFLGSGRHIKIRPGLKMIMGRNFGENNLLEQMAKNHLWVVGSKETAGPSSLLQMFVAWNKLENKKSIAEHWQAQALFSQVSTQEKTSLENFTEKLQQKFSVVFSIEELLLIASIHARYMDKKAQQDTSAPIEIHFFWVNEKKEKTESAKIKIPPFLNEGLLQAHMITANTQPTF